MKHLKYLLLFEEGAEGQQGNQGNTDPTPKGGDGTGDNNNPNGNNNNNNDRTVPKYSDEDLDNIINKRFARWQQQQQEAIDEATRLANMTAQERAEAERDKLQKELNDLKHANTIADMERQARKILADDGIIVPDAILSSLVKDDANATSEAVKQFATVYKASIQDAVKQQLSHKEPQVGGGASGLSKADIMAVKDPVKRQQLIRENMSLFRN